VVTNGVGRGPKEGEVTIRKIAVFAALAATLFWTGSAGADVMAKTDTLAPHCADSTAVLPVSGAARLWLDFIIPPGPPCGTCAYSATADTAVVLLVEAREVLSSAAGTDSTQNYYEGIRADSLLLSRQYVQGAAGHPDSSLRAYALQSAAGSTAAAFSDSTVVPWIPKTTKWGSGGAATADTALTVNSIPPSNLVRSSYQIKVIIPTRFVANGVKSVRAVRVDLIGEDGAPFHAQFAQFWWKMVSGPASAKIRVVLGRETW